RQADARLAGQVDDRVGPGEQLVEGGGDEVELLAPVPGPAREGAGVGPLDRGVVVVGEGVDAHDVVTAVEESGADVPADEAGGPVTTNRITSPPFGRTCGWRAVCADP